MHINEIIRLAKEQGWREGSIWEFDLYIDKLFVETMAFDKYPVSINYFQPVLNDEFLNTKLNNDLLLKFENFFEITSEVENLLANQEKILTEAKILLENIKVNYTTVDYKKYEIIQKNLSLLMASVSVVFDPLISVFMEKINKETNTPLESISSYILNKSGVTALNESNDKLVELYRKNKSAFDDIFNGINKIDSRLKKVLREHSTKYGWINTGEKGRKSWNEKDFLEQLKEIRNIEKNKPSVSKEVERLLEYPIKININDNVAADLQIELDFHFQKYLKNKFKELYDEQIFENLTLKEIEELDINNKSPSNYSDRIDKSKLIFPHNGFAEIKWLNPSEFEILKETVSENVIQHTNTKIVGRPACAGLIEGKAKIVRNQKDLNDFENGYILVAEKTQPSYIMAMKKAIAIVTDIGGITSHAAIVSRELNIPCIVATENATKVIKDNDYIRVDAEQGIVEILDKNLQHRS